MNAAAKKQPRDEAIVEQIEICHCTNSQLERGETCGLDICPNRGRANQGGADE